MLGENTAIMAVLCGVGLITYQASLALKWEKLAFRMRDEELMICTRLLGKEFGHLVLWKNGGQKEATKHLPTILATRPDSSAQPQD